MKRPKFLLRVFICAVILHFLLGIDLSGQQDSLEDNTLTLSAYIDGYYANFNNERSVGSIQPLTTVGARDNTIGLNVAQIGLSYLNPNIRGNITLHYGDIAKATWDEEFNMVQEANVGLHLGEQFWLDAGLFTTHIGTESFLPKNNLLSSTAVKTYNEPFYQAGARLSYEGADAWGLQFWVLNGYNLFLDDNSAKSVGMLLSFDITEDLDFTYTNIYGRESGDGREPSQFRFYQNAYLNYNWKERLYATVGVDYGRQTNSQLQDSEATANMYAGVVTLRYQFTPKHSLTSRYEVFNDPDGFIGGTLFFNNQRVGLELSAFTMGAEYKPSARSYLRMEFRQMVAQEDLLIFHRDNRRQNTRFEFLVTMGVDLEKVLL